VAYPGRLKVYERSCVKIKSLIQFVTR